MSEKIDRRWRINSRAVLEVLYEGHWETAGTRWAYPDNGHNQRFREAVADACGDIDALTSERDDAVRERDRWREIAGEQAGYIHSMSGLVTEACKARDEAVRVAGELRAALERCHDVLDDTNAAAGVDGPMCVWCNETGYDGDGLKHAADCVLVEARHSLTASTGGSSDEPQKEIRE